MSRRIDGRSAISWPRAACCGGAACLLDGEEVGGTKARRATLTVSNGELSVAIDE